MAMVGAEKGNDFISRVAELAPALAEKAKKEGRQLGDQDLGVVLLGTCAMDGTGELFNQPMSALCHYDSEHVDSIWAADEFKLPEVSIGVHWYGGHERSKLWERSVTSVSNFALARLACQSMSVA